MHQSDIRVIAEAQEYKAFRAEIREDEWRRELSKQHVLSDGRIHQYFRWRNKKTRKPHPARKHDPKWANETVDVTNDVLEAV